MFKKRETGLPYRFKLLAEYNTRLSEGIVHTPEYAAEMARLQNEFDLVYRPQLRMEIDGTLPGS